MQDYKRGSEQRRALQVECRSTAAPSTETCDVSKSTPDEYLVDSAVTMSGPNLLCTTAVQNTRGTWINIRLTSTME